MATTIHGSLCLTKAQYVRSTAATSHLFEGSVVAVARAGQSAAVKVACSAASRPAGKPSVAAVARAGQSAAVKVVCSAASRPAGEPSGASLSSTRNKWIQGRGTGIHLLRRSSTEHRRILPRTVTAPVAQTTETKVEVPSIIGFGNDWDDPEEPTGMFAATHSIVATIRNSLASTFAEKLNSPDLSSPPDIQSFSNEEKQAKGGILLSAGKDDSVNLAMEARLRIKSPPEAGGGSVLIWTFTLLLGNTTDMPNITAEFNVSPQRIYFVMDMIPRKDLVTNLQYLSEIYETGDIRALSTESDQNPAFVKSPSSDVFSRVALSPTALLYSLPIPGPEVAPSGDATGKGSGFLEGDSRPAVVAAREHLLPVLQRFLEIWKKMYDERKDNVTDAEEQYHLQRRSKFLRHHAVSKDFDIPMVANLLGKDLSRFICQSCLRGAVRKVTPSEHWYFGRPIWRFWRGLVSCYDTAGKVAMLYRMHRDFNPNEDGSVVSQRNLKMYAHGRMWGGPWDFGLATSREDGIWHPQTDRERLLQLPGGFACSGGYVAEDDYTGCEIIVICNNGEGRYSVTPLYGKDRRLFYVIYDRETALDPDGGNPVSPNVENSGMWSETFELEEDRTFPSVGMEGIETTITKELLMSDYWGSWKGLEVQPGPVSGQDDDAPWLEAEDYTLMHLPDNISVRTPKDLLSTGKRFCVTTYDIREKGLLQMTARYGTDGQFQSLTKAFYAKDV